MEGLTEDERKALRGSKFAPLPSSTSLSRSQPRETPYIYRLAHPGGRLKTNKASALAKFLERKLQEPNGLSSINPELVELAVKKAKETVKASSASNSEIQHVNLFGDSQDTIKGKEEGIEESLDQKKKKRRKKDKKKWKTSEVSE